MASSHRFSGLPKPVQKPIEDFIGDVHFGDNVAKMKEMPSHSVDLIFADPPYRMQLGKATVRRFDGSTLRGVKESWDGYKPNKTQEEKANEIEELRAYAYLWLGECKRLLKPHGTLFVCGDDHCADHFSQIMYELGLYKIAKIIWNKPNPTPNFAGSNYGIGSEEILVRTLPSGKSARTFNAAVARELFDGTLPSTVWTIMADKAELVRDKKTHTVLHPTQKPEELLKRILLVHSNADDIVLDPFFGTGTTGAVAKRYGRRWIGIESDERYIKAARERITAVAVDLPSEYREPPKAHHPRLMLSELITAKLIKSGTAFYMKPNSAGVETNPRYVAYLGKKSKLKILFGVRKTEADMHNMAGFLLQLRKREKASGLLADPLTTYPEKERKEMRANGWDIWYVKDSEGNFISLNALRIKYFEMESSPKPPADLYELPLFAHMKSSVETNKL